MQLGMPLGELLLLAAGVIAAGVLTGLLAGLLGVGGAAITVPVLYEVFRILGVPEEVRMQLCIGTSLAIIVPVSVRSYLAHRARSAVREDVLRLWAAPVVVGVIAGSAIAYVAPGTLFKVLFVCFASGMAMQLLFGRNWRLGDKLPGKAAVVIVGFAIGLFSTLMGTGGGSFGTIFLTLYGHSIHVAIATSSGIGALISVPGVVGYAIAGWPQMQLLPPFSVGYVSLLGLALFAPASVLAAPLGARLAHRLPRRGLEIGFALFLSLVAIRFTWSLLG